MDIGVLAIQGSVVEHVGALTRAANKLNLDLTIHEIRRPEDVVDTQGKLKISGLIMPGGESTTQSKLLIQYGLFDILKEKISEANPKNSPQKESKFFVWGTCAGSILLAKEVSGSDGKILPRILEVMDIKAERNAYGTHAGSFEAELDCNFDSSKVTTEAVFIRAPKLTPMNENCIVIAAHNGQPVAILQRNMLATSFHPELTDDTTLHEFFLRQCLSN